MNHKSLVVCDHYPTRTNEEATKTTTSTKSLHIVGRCRPTRCRLVAYFLFLYTSATLQAAVAYAQESSERGSGVALNRITENDHNDGLLFYTRLRYDQNYLPIYKNLQKQFPYEETRLQLGLLQGHTNDNDDGNDDDDDVNRQVVEYYVNPNISLHDLTQNDLILEALDQVYRSRLLQSYEFTYDNPEDRKRAADPRKVNKKRCHRELDYLLSKLKPAAASGHNRKWPLMGGISPELAAFFDSYATEEAGVLLGNVFWLGNWQQCQKRHIFDPHNRANFKGRYCVASIGAAEWAEKIEQKIAHLKRIDYFKFTNQEHNYRRSFRIQLGICLPESCDSTIVDSSPQRRDDIQLLSLLRLGPPYDSYNLTDLYCLPDESSPLRQIPASGRLLIGLGLIWLLLLLVSTYADAHDLVGLGAVVKQKSRKSFLQKIVISYSLIRNYQHLVQSCRRPASTTDKQTPVFEASESKQNGFEKANGSKKKEDIVKQQEPHVSDLQFFDAFKVLATAIILGGHIGMIILRFAQYSLDFFTIPPAYFHFVASTAFYVDWFFCMTGFITAYANFASRSVYTNTRIHWLYSVFHRYWRLAPIYLLTFWFCRSLFQYTSHGPLWDYGTSNASLRAICQQESWLAPLTLTSNWHPLHRECIMPAWYIANDMQFYLITPFLLLALAYRPRLAWMSVLGMSLASVLARAERYYTDSHAQHLELMHPRFDLVMRNNWDLHRIYLWPHYRISPYLIGLLAGHYAFMVKSGRWSSPFTAAAAAATERRQPEATANESAASNSNGFQKVAHLEKKKPTTDWRRNRTILAWTGLYVTCTVSMTSYLLDTSFPRRLEPFARPIVAVVYALGHSIAGAGVAALFVALLLGQWPRVRALMELPAWSKLAKINYFVYLFQVEIITWASQAQNKLPEVSLFEQLKLLALLGPLLYALAWLVTLLVANPLAKLEIEFVGVYARPSAATSGPSRAEREKQRRQCGGSAGCEQVTCARNGTTTAGRAVEVFDKSAAGAGLAVKQVAARCRQQAAANWSC